MKAKGLEKFTIHDGDHKVLVSDSGTLRAVPYKTYILSGDSRLCFSPRQPGEGLPLRGSAQAVPHLQLRVVGACGVEEPGDH